jgi:hypothetical protein
MYVHIYFARIDGEEQGHDWMAIARQIVRVSRAHGANQQLVAHGTVIHKKILAERIGAREGGQRRIAFDR